MGGSAVAIDDERLHATLAAVFGYSTFRPLQQEIIRATLDGRDVFALLPTGGGKSLCYQLPALLRSGLTVVVSPLIALMKDQVDALTALGVNATYINSSLEYDELRARQDAVVRGEVRLLYVAPERLMLPGFLRLLERVPLAGFAIDEAHCISEWGHDFRPEYRELRRLRQLFPATPLAAFTATATARVEQDILEQLGLEEAARFRGSFNRANLFYEVRPKRNAYHQLVAYLRDHRRDSGIIYCQSRAGTEKLAEKLQDDGFPAAAYHAGLESDERRRRQEDFSRDRVPIVVATVAFGMGIDKPDVRFVIHYDLPKNLESYYQESGRAGRDGEPSDCILFFSRGDVAKQQRFIEEKPTLEERRVAHEQLRQMADWADAHECRRRALLAYFDEEFAGQSGPCCDVCRTPVEEVDYTIPAQMLLSCVVRTGQRFGMNHVVDVLRGSQSQKIQQFGHERLSTYGIGRDRRKAEWLALARELVRRGYLSQDPERFNTLAVTEPGWTVLRGEETVRLAKLYERGAGRVAEPAGDVDDAVFEELRALRRRLAEARGVPPYVIFHDSTLRELAGRLPTTQAALRRVTGVGERKAEDFGEAVLAVLAPHAEAKGVTDDDAQEAFDFPPPRERRRTPGLSDTAQASLDLFDEGLDLAEIAHRRGLARSTIEGHLTQAIAGGALTDLDRLVPPERQQAILAAIEALDSTRLTPLLEHLGADYSYSELRFVVTALGQGMAPTP
ncbi:MAG TPA: DNA helicase RecQ [Thermomicrobiaceae bacterium]|nr:DNA helicase RecQ [Thermomicrobiaceae bacterium]